MKSLLLIIDYQYDFVARDGALTAGSPAAAIEQTLVKKINEYRARGGDVLFTKDRHNPNEWQRHPESRVFKPHCIPGTPGYELYGSLKTLAEEDEIIPKRAYCMPHDTLKKLVNIYDVIEITGVVTDICVLQNAIGFYTEIVNSGKDTRLIVDSAACASFDPSAHARALDYMRDTLGLEIT